MQHQSEAWDALKQIGHCLVNLFLLFMKIWYLIAAAFVVILFVSALCGICGGMAMFSGITPADWLLFLGLLLIFLGLLGVVGAVLHVGKVYAKVAGKREPKAE